MSARLRCHHDQGTDLSVTRPLPRPVCCSVLANRFRPPAPGRHCPALGACSFASSKKPYKRNFTQCGLRAGSFPGTWNASVVLHVSVAGFSFSYGGTTVCFPVGWFPVFRNYKQNCCKWSGYRFFCVNLFSCFFGKNPAIPA